MVEFGSGTEVVLVLFTEPAHLDEYRRRNDLPFTVVADPDRVGYRAYGLGRGTVRRVYGWRSLRRYGQILRRGRSAGLRRPTEDTLQLGGDFVVDAEGRLAWGFWGQGPDDRPSVDDLIAAVAQARG